MVAKRAAVWLERVLVFIGCACIAYYGYVTIEGRQFQQQQKAAFEALETGVKGGETGVEGGIGGKGAAGAPVAPAAPTTPARTAPGIAPAAPAAPITPVTPIPPAPAASARKSSLELTANMVGILEIPRLGIESAVMSGDDDKTLDVAVGHLPDTPKPWQPGNSAVAAHRDGLFRPLKNIKVGDDLRVRTAHGEFAYKVRELKIVTPKDLSVLEPTGTDMLTLITCYPFNYIGNAPKRFIVRATRVQNGT